MNLQALRDFGCVREENGEDWADFEALKALEASQAEAECGRYCLGAECSLPKFAPYVD